jgi:hypothetical protein
MSLRTRRSRAKRKCITGKWWYPNMIAARQHALAIPFGAQLRAYRCDLCTGWHLTSKDYTPSGGQP